MAGGIKIDFAADVSKFIAGTGDIESALDDVSDALDDVNKAGKDVDSDVGKSLQNVGDNADDAARSVQDMADQTEDAAKSGGDALEKKFRDAFDGVKKASEDSAKGIKDSFKENALTADDVFMADLKAELVSNMAESGAEVARGFKDGFDSEDAETVLDGLTDTMVSVGALGGPLGTAAGLAGAVAVQSFAGPLIEGAKEKAEQFEATFAEAFDNIVSGGAEAGRELTISNTVTTLAQDTEKMNQVTQTANDLGVERGVILRAMAGDQDAYAAVMEKVSEREAANTQYHKEADEALKNGTMTTEEAIEANQKWAEQQGKTNDATKLVTGAYDNNTDALNAATDAAGAKAEADAYAAEKAADNAKALAKSTGEAQDFTAVIDGATVSLRAMPNGKVVKVTDDGTAKLTQDEINAIEGKDVNVNVVTTGLGSAQADLARLHQTYNGKTIHMNVETRRTGGFYK